MDWKFALLHKLGLLCKVCEHITCTFIAMNMTRASCDFHYKH